MEKFSQITIYVQTTTNFKKQLTFSSYTHLLREAIKNMRDGHVHTSYCPHGTKDSFNEYIERALTLGYTEMSFTEHAPLPKSFEDPAPTKDSAMDFRQLESYLHDLESLKMEYSGQIKINAGLEVDYIEGFEKEISDFLSNYGPYLDDSILSVHFLKKNGQYDCMDYSPEVFAKMVTRYHSIEAIYHKYYQTVLKAVLIDLGPYKPIRMGHITLVQKFQKKFPTSKSFAPEIIELLHAIKDQQYELDYNGAGTAKPLCREPYPPNWVVDKACELEIPLIYGSDAHQIKELNQGKEQMIFLPKKTS